MKTFAINVAKKASSYLLKNFRKDSSLLAKRTVAKGLTTNYDLGSNKIIVKEISRKYPDHNILSEESGFINKKSSYTWIIDPLDGSSNFANNNPFFSVSIALMKNDELILGVINAPYLKELYFAEKGRGAYLNGNKIHVTGIKNLKKSYLLSCEGGDKNNYAIAKINSELHPQVRDLRKLGSAALEIANVAAGRAEAYLTTKICSWDVAAGILLLKEAGGKVSNFQGKEWNWKLKSSDLLFSNGKVHNLILKKLQNLQKKI